MRRLNLLRNVNPTRVSLVGKGANRKVFFLRKSGDDVEVVEGEGPDKDLIHLPAQTRLVKAEDWSTVYCVVAEPNWEEDPGLGAPEPDVPDLWADEDEIRKACHRFAENGGLINAMHAGIEPWGVLVENATAQTDFTVNGQTIRKGSWYIAIKPNEEGRQAIEKGEFTGVSLEGEGLRVAIEKAEAEKPPPAPGPNPGRLGKGMRNFLRKFGEAVGLSDEDLAELDADEMEKAAATFAGIMAERTFEDELPDAFSALRDAVWRAFYPPVGEDVDPKASISQSLDEFKTWAVALLEDTSTLKKLGEQAERDHAAEVALEKSLAEVVFANDEDETLRKAGDSQLEVWMAMTAADLDAHADEADAITKAARSFASAQRRKYAKQKIAMPDGSFPIPDTDALKRAMKAVGRASKSKVAAVKAHIRRRAKALGATNLLTPAFKKSAPDETSGSVEDEMGLSAEEREQLDGLNKAVAELPDKLAASLAEVLKSNSETPPPETPPAGDPPAGETPPPAAAKPAEGEDTDLRKAVEDLTSMVKALGEGSSTQREFDPEDPKNIAKAENFKREFEARELPPELIGLTSDLAADIAARN